MKKLFLSIGIATLGFMSASAQGKLLIVHNSPDPTVATVDIWVEVPQVAQYFKVADDLSYKGGFFYSIPAIPISGATLTVHIKSSASTVSGDADLFTKAYPAVPTGNNIMIATGLVDAALKAAKTNPSSVSNDFDLLLKSTNVEFSSPSTTSLNVAIHHGAIDAPSVYVQSFITTIQQPARDTLVAGAVYKDITNHSLVPASSRRLHVIATGQPQTAPAYTANGDALKTLSNNNAAFVVATGFLDTTGTGTTNSFKLLAYVTNATTADGPLAAVELPREKVAGVVQVYHNAADPAVKAVDLYVGGMKQVIGLNFRAAFQSAGFIQDFDYNIDLHKKDSASSVLSTTLRFDSDSVVAVVSGVLNPAGFTANPDAESTALDFYLQKPARVTQPAGTTQITVFHGATDAPTVSLTVPALGGAALITGLKYGQFQVAQASGNPALPTSLGTVMVDLKLPGGATYKSYLVPLAALDGKAVTVCASGFVDSAANQNGAAFRLFAGLSSAPFPQIVFLKDTATTVSINDPATSDLQFRMFPNPASSELIIAFDMQNTGNVAIDILDLNGRVVKNVVNTVFDNGTVAMTEDIRNLESGLYVARVISDKKTSTYKFNVVR